MEKLILNNRILNRIYDSYNDCIKDVVSGEDTDYNNLKLDVLYELRVELWKSIQSKEYINDDIVDAWTILQTYNVLIKLRESKYLEFPNMDLYDSVADEIFMEIANI